MADTASWIAGLYRWFAYVTDNVKRFQVGSGYWNVKPDPATIPAGFDSRSHVKKTLDAIEALLEKKPLADAASYSIGGRSLSKMSPEELLRWRGIYRAEYQAEISAEKIEKDLAPGNKILTRFV